MSNDVYRRIYPPYLLEIFIFCTVICMDYRNVVSSNKELRILLNRWGCIFIFEEAVPCEKIKCTVYMLVFFLCNIVVWQMRDFITLIDIDFLGQSAMNAVGMRGTMSHLWLMKDKNMNCCPKLPKHRHHL